MIIYFFRWSIMSCLTAVISTSALIATLHNGHAKAMQFHLVPFGAVPVIVFIRIVVIGFVQCGQITICFPYINKCREIMLFFKESDKCQP
jgi:hypothetical protein